MKRRTRIKTVEESLLEVKEAFEYVFFVFYDSVNKIVGGELNGKK